MNFSFARLIPTVLAPTVAYFALHLLGVDDVPALCVAAVFPLVATLVDAVRERRIDPIGALSTVVTVLGIASALFVHDPRLVLEANALPGLLVGVVFLGSAALGRPFLGAIVRHADAAMRLTCVWGAALTVAGLSHVAVGWWAPAAVAVAISPVVTAVTLLPALTWSVRLQRRAVRAAAAGAA